MNPLQRLQAIITASCTDISCSIDAPAHENGAWFLDMQYNGMHFVAEWGEHTDFGLSVITGESPGYGERPQEHYRTTGEMHTRIRELIRIGATSRTDFSQAVREQMPGWVPDTSVLVHEDVVPDMVGTDFRTLRQKYAQPEKVAIRDRAGNITGMQG